MKYFQRAFTVAFLLSGFISVSQTRLVSHISREAGGFTPGVIIANLDRDEDHAYTLMPYSQSGTQLATVSGTVSAGSTIFSTPADLFAGEDVSHFSITGDEEIQVTVTYQSTQQVSSPVHVHESRLQSKGWRVYPGNWAVVWDGLAIVNTGNAAADIEIFQTDSEGRVIGVDTSLRNVAPFEKRLAVLGATFTNMPESYFEIEATESLGVTSLRGSYASADQQLLWENVPIPYVQDQIPANLFDLSGVWELSTTVASNTCGLENESTNTDWIVLMQCGSEVSVMMGSGLWGTGIVRGDRLDFTGTEVLTDETGCQVTRISTGTLYGTSTLMEGSFGTTVTFDPGTCGTQNNCVVETSSGLSLIAAYESSCLDRDEFGTPADSEYILPYPAGSAYENNNTYCLPTGHRFQQAYDFLVPVGEAIVASRAGVVRQIKEDSPDDGQGSDHNHIMVEHADGTVGFYAHLMQDGVLVDVGDTVEPGQIIAYAGHSGTTDVPHLHFGVYDSYPPMEGFDRAVNFSNMDGPLDCRGGLVNGATYTAR